MTVNGHLQYTNVQCRLALEKLRDATAHYGGWESCVAEARAHRAELDAAVLSESAEDTPPSERADGTKMSYVDADTAYALRKRLAAIGKQGNSAQEFDEHRGETYQAKVQSGLTAPHPLVDHPDKTISRLAYEYSDLESEMKSPGPKLVRWPDNISLRDFALYQLTPTLVYELEYPRTDRYVGFWVGNSNTTNENRRIRPLYLFEKTVATFGTFALLYTVTESFIIPLTPTPNQSFLRSLLDLAMPFMISYLLLFYIIFGNIHMIFLVT
jgi:sterol O-acyltransferase